MDLNGVELNVLCPGVYRQQPGANLNLNVCLCVYSMYDNLVPEMWAAKAYPSLKPLSSWTGDLVERTRFIADWIEKGTPAVYWISGFFFPQVWRKGRAAGIGQGMVKRRGTG